VNHLYALLILSGEVLPMSKVYAITPWFEGVHKPSRDGVYQRKFIYTNKVVWARYTKGKWYDSNHDYSTALASRVISCIQTNQFLSWRGIFYV